ncbi:MAG TPA: energy transducer TonB [Longimicrobium sp.]|jgi:TonB family protein
MQPLRYSLLAALLLSAGRAAAQETAPPPVAPPPPVTEGTFDISAIEVRPMIRNGPQATRVAEEAFGKAVGPEGGRGSVTLRFVVKPNGTTSRAMVVAPTGNPAIDEAALTVLRAMRFSPGQIRERSAPVLVELPLSYDVPPRKAECAAAPAPSNP